MRVKAVSQIFSDGEDMGRYEDLSILDADGKLNISG